MSQLDLGFDPTLFINNFDSCADQLTQEMLKAVEDWVDPYPAMFSVQMSDTSQKYPASSAFQKSLRRGFTAHAVYYIEAIYNSFERDYLWMRLPLVVLEDIGLGNWKLCAYTIHFCRFKKVRDSFENPLKALHYLIHHLTDGTKSRALSEAVCLAYFCKHTVPTEEIQYIGDCMAACGWKPDPKESADSPWVNKAPSMARVDLYKEVADLAEEFPEDRIYIRYCFHAGLKKNTAYQNAAIPHILRLFKETGETEIHTHQIDPVKRIGKYPDVSYDKHTLIGKKVNGRLGYSKAFPVEFTQRQLGLCIFQCESAVIDKELTSKALLAMQKRSYDYELIMVGMSVEDGDKMKDFLTSESGKALLFSTRHKVVLQSL